MIGNRFSPAAGGIARFMSFLLSALLLGFFSLPVRAAEIDDESDTQPEAEVTVVPGTDAEAAPEAATELPPDEELRAPAMESMPGLFAAQNAPTLLADSREDPNYILAEKTFVGLPPELIPEGFQVTVFAENGETYTLNRENALSHTTDEDGNTLWRWKILGVGTGIYTVRESGEDVEHYTVTRSGEGTVEVRAADMTVLVPVHKTTCSHTNWPVRVDGDSSVLFAATLTQGGVAVISRTPLSASQRAAVSQTVLKINGPWKTPVYFYSIEEQLRNGNGFELNGATITYDASAEEVIIGRTSNWQHVATLEYSISEAYNPEIALRNAYARSATNVTVRKTVAGNMADREKRFDFTVSVRVAGADADFRMNGTACAGWADFSLKDGESVLLEDVPVGAELTVQEHDYSGERYVTSGAVDGGEAVPGRTVIIPSVAEEGHSIHFTNQKDYVPDTGIALDSLPYWSLLGISLAGLIAIRSFRRKRCGR